MTGEKRLELWRAPTEELVRALASRGDADVYRVPEGRVGRFTLSLEGPALAVCVQGVKGL